jgi:hypothetical protein
MNVKEQQPRGRTSGRGRGVREGMESSRSSKYIICVYIYMYIYEDSHVYMYTVMYETH